PPCGARAPCAAAGEGQGEGPRARGPRPPRPGAALAGRASEVADMGSRHGAGRPRRVHHRHRRPGLLLRPAEPLATGHEREHEPPPAAVLPERHDTLGVLTSRPQPCGTTPQSASPGDAGISLACRGLRGKRCVDLLSPSGLSTTCVTALEAAIAAASAGLSCLL